MAVAHLPSDGLQRQVAGLEQALGLGEAGVAREPDGAGAMQASKARRKRRSGTPEIWVAAGTTYGVSQSGTDTLVTLSDGTTLTLAGVAVASLPTGWVFTA